jgi:hypothetical protein
MAQSRGSKCSTSLVVACALALAGCSLGFLGEEDDRGDDGPVCFCDAGWQPEPERCDLFTQAGCAVGEKCTWIRVSTGANDQEQLGLLGCAPDGTVPLAGACMYGASGATTGYDNCVQGAICVAEPASEMAAGTCQAICSLDEVTLPCLTAHACVPRAKFFFNSPMERLLAGVCEPSCDPLTQRRDLDGAAMCGSADPSAPELGCYGFPSSDQTPTRFTCAPAGSGGHRTVVAPPVFTNSCAPGAVPLFVESTGSTQVVCIAYCAPLTTNVTMPLANRAGAPPYSCPEVGAPGPGERCQHLWFWEDAATPRSAASNAYGFCIDFTRYTWDHDMNGATPPVSWTLPETTTPYVDPTNPQPTEDLFWGAAPYPATLTGAPRFRPPAARGLELRPL